MPPCEALLRTRQLAVATAGFSPRRKWNAWRYGLRGEGKSGTGCSVLGKLKMLPEIITAPPFMILKKG
jgi:hypothetical protein